MLSSSRYVGALFYDDHVGLVFIRSRLCHLAQFTTEHNDVERVLSFLMQR